MRTVALGTLIGKSFDRTIEILFRPFSLRKWMILLLIAFLAGALGGGGNSGGGGDNVQRPSKQEASQIPGQDSSQEAGEKAAEPTETIPSFGIDQTEPSGRPSTLLLVALIGIPVLLIVAIAVGMIWVGARFRFVWFNAIANNRADIVEPFSRHAKEANSLFKFALFISIAILCFLAVIGGSAVYLMFRHGVFAPGFEWSVPAALKIFLLPGIVLITALIGFALLAYAVDHFVVPIMALDGLRAAPALRKFSGIFRSSWRDIILFTIVFLFLSLVSGVMAMVVAIFLLLAVAVIGLVIFGIPFLIIVTLLKAKLIFIIYAVIAAIPLLAVTLVALTAIGLPFAVFFRAFSINYLVSLDCGYTQESLAAYSVRRAERLSRKAPVVISVISPLLLLFVFIIGLLAAIAVPNFVAARQKALERQKAGVSLQRNQPARPEDTRLISF